MIGLYIFIVGLSNIKVCQWEVWSTDWENQTCDKWKLETMSISKSIAVISNIVFLFGRRSYWKVYKHEFESSPKMRSHIMGPWRGPHNHWTNLFHSKMSQSQSSTISIFIFLPLDLSFLFFCKITNSGNGPFTILIS